MGLPHILIATPTYRGMVTAKTVLSLMQARDILLGARANSTFLTVEAFDIVTARTMVAAYLMERPEFTHLLFVDDDMEFPPEAVLALLGADKPVIGCVCPKRVIDLEAFYVAAAEGRDFEAAGALAHRFVIKLLEGPLRVEAGICPVAGLGMGVTLIRRDAFEMLAGRGGVKERAVPLSGGVDAFGGRRWWGFFDPLPAPDGSGFLSEDFSFCQRWRDTGGSVFAEVTHRIGHVGQYAFEGRYLDRLKTGRP